jgi:perosamine synthetase
MSRDTTMYVPAWQGLALRDLSGPARGGPRPFPLDAAHAAYFHTARNAIYQLFRKLVQAGRRTVLVPDYHMGNEVRAIRAAGARVLLYPVGRDLQPDLDLVRRRCDAGVDVLFTIHYAGWPQPVRALRELCDGCGAVLVEDCALALFTETEGRPVGTFGHYAVFCLYKTLPVLDGGVLVQNEEVFTELDALECEPVGRAFEWGRAAELWIERYRGRGALAHGWRRSNGAQAPR